jgi:hypothetical protein
MKIPVKKNLVLLILMTAFALTLAMVGDVLASPCLHLDIYPNADGTGQATSCGTAVPFFGAPDTSNHTVLDPFGRLWFGLDSVSGSPGSFSYQAKGWDWQSDNDYKAVLVGGIVNNGALGQGGLRLVLLNSAKFTGLNDSGTLMVFDPVTGNPIGTSVGWQFGGTDPVAWGGDQPIVYYDLYFPMQTGVVYPFKVEYTHVGTGFTHDGFDLRFIENGGGATESFTDYCPPQQVAEPSTMLLLGFGVIGLGVAARRKFGK